MRIIVGNDFYDCGMAYGHDETLCFVRSRDHHIDQNVARKNHILPPSLDLSLEKIRKRPDVTVNSFGYTNSFRFNPHGKDPVIYLFLPICVVLAAKIYRGVKVIGQVNEDVYLWTEDAFNKWIDNFSLKVRRRQGFWNYVSVEDYYKPVFVSAEAKEWLIQNKLTILTYDPDLYRQKDVQWRANGDNLKKLHFMKVMDPITTFQIIEMWVGNILPRTSEFMIEITDDKIKVAKHGFDKFSFRKGKEPKVRPI